MNDYLRYIQQSRWRMFTLGAMIVSIIIVFMDIVPGFKEIFQMWGQLHHNKQAMQQTLALEANFDQIKTDKILLQKALKDFMFSKQQKIQLSSIINLITESAEKQKVSIKQTLPQPIDKKEGHLEMPIQLKMTARYHDLARFINHLETTEPVIKIIQMSVESQSLTTSRLNAQVYLIVYYLEQSA